MRSSPVSKRQLVSCRYEFRRWAISATVAAVLLGGSLVSVEAGSSSAASAKSPYVSDPVSLVNPFIGTADGGNTFPGADVPFGMVQWSPDTVFRPDGGGYEYDSTSIIGYSLTHLSGPGCQAEGDVPILPTTGAISADPALATEPLHHRDETASPGYYRLDSGGVNTQLTTTLRSGMATFTFPATASQGNLLFKMSDSETYVSASQFNRVNDKEVDGSVTTGDFCGASNTYTVYFDMIFNRAFVKSGSWTTGGNGDYVSFDTASNAVVKAKVGISYESTADAAENRAVENPGWSFKSVMTAAQKSWQAMLSKVKVGGGTTTQQTVFYTALYHSLLQPNVFSDVNGEYMGYDGKVHKVAAPQVAQYANYSGWDIYRSEVPLEAILAPQQTSDIVTSMLNDYSETGNLPKWAEDDGESYIMVGDPADGIIADAYAFGARDFDARRALSDMEKEATVPNDIRPGLAYYEKDGYLPLDGSYGCCNFYGPVSTQQEYDTADDSIALFASDLGDSTVAQNFASRAQNWQNVFNPGSGFLQPKDSAGQFEPGFNAISRVGFVEADSYVYTAMVPFDLEGVIAAEGGDAAWVHYLDGVTSSVTSMGVTRIQMGDEPSFDIPWEYDYAGDPSGTQHVVREIQDKLYTDKPGGLAGNDDLGAMSSWYVWSALGGYPEMPGSATIALGSPLFSSISIELANGKTITETAPGAGKDAPYVQSLKLDGASWKGAYLPPGVFSEGATLTWTLGTTPDADWGSSRGDAPPSNTTDLLPALGYLGGADNGDVVVSPGGSTTLTLGVQSTSGATQKVRWTSSSTTGSGIVVRPATGKIVVLAEAKATQRIELQVPAGTKDGQYLVRFSLRATSGAELPQVVAEVDVV
jgi:predicted alpha-1,2-mannosidase